MISRHFYGRAVARKTYLLVSIGAACVLSSCGSSTESLESAKRGVMIFHAQLDTEQYAAAYAASDDRLRRATSQPDFIKLLEAVHRKLGTVEQANLQNTRFAWYTGQGAPVTLIYATKLSTGSANEQFVWHIKSGAATLYGYNIDSDDLITR
jgi:hypothetical protein